MKVRAVFAAATLAVAPTAASANCVVQSIANLPVTLQGARPLVEARINGAPAMFLVDSGAFYSLISPATATQFHLRETAGPAFMQIKGIGGTAQMYVAEIKDFDLAGQKLENKEFVVGGSESGGSAVGAIGRNILSIADVEYDLAGGVIRLMQPKGCSDKAMFAYWAKPPLSVGVVDEDWVDTPGPIHFQPPIVAAATINGKRIKVILDTGAAGSMLTLAAARRIGIGPGAPGVEAAGVSGGAGPRLIRDWIAPVDVFEIGGEQIQHTSLRVGDTDLGDGDMLLGADFFLSHHVYVANSQHKIYFTYNGGPVFNLGAPANSEPPPPGVAAETPTDAAGYANRAAAEAARREFPAAIADYGKAMDLDPSNAGYALARGFAHAEAGHPALAIADANRALTLAPTDARALIFRAGVRAATRDHAGSAADLDAVDKVLAPQANDRIVVARFYELDAEPAKALAQYDLWIRFHPDDSRLGGALAGRCWARALLGTDLDKAMGDCQRSLRQLAGDTLALEARGLLLLRQGEPDKAIADFTLALKAPTRSAWSCYGRGLAEQKKGLSDQAKADLAAAIAIEPGIAKTAAGFGIGP